MSGFGLDRGIFYLHHNVHTSSGAHPAFSYNGYRGSSAVVQIMGLLILQFPCSLLSLNPSRSERYRKRPAPSPCRQRSDCGMNNIVDG